MSSIQIDDLTSKIYGSIADLSFSSSLQLGFREVIESDCVFWFGSFGRNNIFCLESGKKYKNKFDQYYEVFIKRFPDIEGNHVGDVFEINGNDNREKNAINAPYRSDEEIVFDSAIGVVLGKREGIVFHVAAYGLGVGAVETEKRRNLFKAVAPHFIQANKIIEDRQHIEQKLEGVSAALNCVEFGVFVLDDQMRVISVNTAAERILQQNDGLSAPGGYLTATSMNNARDLVQLVQGAAAGIEDQSNGGAMRLARHSELRPYSVVVAPHRHEYMPCGNRKSTAIIFVTDPEGATRAEPGIYRQLFDLTVSEANVAASLCAGMTIKSIAEVHGLSAETVRGYVKRVFGKTQTNSQAQLVSLLASVADPLKPA